MLLGRAEEGGDESATPVPVQVASLGGNEGWLWFTV
jgi:hypothetical protein